MVRSNLLILIAMLCWPLMARAELNVQEVKVGGLTAWLVEDYHVPAIEVRLLFENAGYISDPLAQQGRAALAAALLMEGAGTRTAGEFHRALDDKAIQLDVNLGRDALSVSMTTLAEHKTAAFDLLSQMLTQPRFDKTSIAEVKRRFIVQRHSLKESPYYLAAKAYNDRVYKGHPYAQEKLGSAQSVATLDKAELKQYREEFITQGNVIIAVSGAISADELSALLRDFIGDLHAGSDTGMKALENITIPKQSFEIQVSKGLPQTVLLFASEGIDRKDKRFYAAYILNHILGGGSLTSRLGEEVRKKRGLTYGINTSLESDLYVNRWSGTVATQQETAAQAKEVILQTLKQIASDGVSAQEVQAAKDYITGSFPLQVDSNSGIASYLLSMQLYDLGSDYFTARNDYFNAVSLEAVNAIAQEWLQPERWSWVEVGPQPQPEKKKEEQ